MKAPTISAPISNFQKEKEKKKKRGAKDAETGVPSFATFKFAFENLLVS